MKADVDLEDILSVSIVCLELLCFIRHPGGPSAIANSSAILFHNRIAGVSSVSAAFSVFQLSFLSLCLISLSVRRLLVSVVSVFLFFSLFFSLFFYSVSLEGVLVKHRNDQRPW